MQKRIISLFLVLILLAGMVPVPVQAAEPDSTMDSSDVTIEGTNGFGNLLSAELQAEYEEETQDTGNYSVLGLEITGNTAKVEYASMEEAVLVVALYTEDGLQLLTSGKTTVDPTEDIATVTIEGNMPEYFQASAYLVDTYDFSPLCASYDTPMYTREMQELLVSTVEDYDADRVLQLDEDKTTNFAVYAEDTILIEEQPGVNTVTSVNDATSTYVIENADDSITSLQEGDIFAYPYGENEILIVKVASISVVNGTATITGEEMKMEEAFSHVKIETSGNTADMQVREDVAVDGVTFEGLVSDGVAPMAADGSVGAEKTLKYTLDKKLKGEAEYAEASVKLAGSLSLKLKVEFSFYVSASRQFFDLETGVNLKAEVSVSGKLAGKLPLIPFGFSPVAGVYIDFQPNLTLEFSGKLSYSLSAGVAMSMTYESGKGFGFHFKPEADSKLELEGAVFFGIDMNPSLGIVGGSVMEMELSMPVGVKLEAKFAKADSTGGSTIHTCDKCLDMDLKFEAEVEVKLQFLKWDKLTLEKKATFQIKIGDLYYSFDKDVLGWGECPNVQYRVTVQTRTPDSAAANVEVLVDGKVVGNTDSKGLRTVYLPAGNHSFSATIGGKDCYSSSYITKACKVVLSEINVDHWDKIHEIVTDSGNIIASGTCGENATWTLNEKGVLVISGSGPMDNWNYGTSPWINYRSKIQKVVISEGITTVGSVAFYNCLYLKSVTLPEGITDIGWYSFDGCHSLTEITLPESVTTIVKGAFIRCKGLISIAIPAGVTSIGDWAFDSCEKLEEIRVDADNAHYSSDASGVLFNKDQTRLLQAPGAISGIYEIPESVTAIADSAFYQCEKLEGIYVSDKNPSYSSDESGALFDKDKTRMIQAPGAISGYYQIPQGVTEIEDNVFVGCKNLTGVAVPEGVTFLPNFMFADCWKLTTVALPSSLTTMGHSPFIGCYQIKDVYYAGTEEQWSKIENNHYLTEATIHYNSTGPAVAAAETLSPEAATQEIPKLDAVYGGEYDTEELEDYTLKTASFTGLVPNEKYLLLAVKGLEAEDILSANNLLYIDQAVAGEDGTLAFEYVQRTPATVSYVMACGASNKNLNGAVITFPEMTADGTVHAADPTVVYEGTTLTEGTDYVLLGDVTYSEAGTYTCFVRGVHRYTGLVTCTYTVTSNSENPPIEESTPTAPPVEETKPTEPEDTKPTEPEDTKPTEPEGTKPTEPKYDNPFEDVFEADYYYDPVLWAVNEGITNGMDATHFAPNGTCTRAQIVTFLWRANGSPASGGTNPFMDVPVDAWYTDAVLWAVEKGITTGTSATTFSPDAGCTRGQVATFLWRSQGQPSVNGENIFTDIAPGAYYYDAVLWAVANNITNGMGEGLFAPDATCTRGQIVTFLYRAMA